MNNNIYNPRDIEQKWQAKWAENKAFLTSKKVEKDKKRYILDMFPYPSGAGLHVGHVESYTATDIYSRYLRMKGFDVLHPQGFDAFGLPAENYAIKTGVHPAETTKKAIKTFKHQIDSMGFSYDWEREVVSSDPNYYKWTQWLFLLFYKNGLAYKKKAKVNWCPKCQTVLANEQAEGGECDRCGSDVIQKDLEQWFFKITDFIEDNDVSTDVRTSVRTLGLLSGLDKVDWPESTKLLQKNWIGKSVGVEFKMPIENSQEFIEVFTTRIDTAFGITYAVAAPENEIVEKLKNKIKNWKEVEEYIQESKNKTDVERMEAKEKTGVELQGVKVINPFNNEAVPLFVADYVLGHYGTGAVMAVPAHDERDFEFAKKYNLPVVQVIKKENIIPRSYLMGGNDISDKEINELGIKILGKNEKGERKLEIPTDRVSDYVNLIEKKLTPGFWNEIIGSDILFIFKSKTGEIEKIILDKDTSKEIEKLGAEYNDEPYLGEVSTWKWLAENDTYTDLIIHTEYGILINSEGYDGLSSQKAKEKMTDWLEKKGIGKKKVNYRLRDWLISRQRYWGAPIPIIYCDKCGEVPVPEDQLPVVLPDDVGFKPTGESPLKYSKKFQEVKCPECGGEAKRESDTMDTFVCSSWYYLRYSDPKNDQEFASKENLKKWLPIDLYVGGAEHSVLHLLYSRFFTKVLHKLGYLEFDEPFLKLRHQGTILATDGTKMSKSKGNVVNPDEIVERYGADALRMYEMFMGPLEDAKPWNTKGAIGVYRFLERAFKLFKQVINKKTENPKCLRNTHKTIKKVTEDIENLKFNTAIAAMMEYLNYLEKACIEKNSVNKKVIEIFNKILSPFAPHLAEDLWQKLGHKESIFKETWPEYDEKLTQDDEIDLVVQINGKLRDTIKTQVDISEDDAIKIAKESQKVAKFLEGQKIKKVIFISGKLINFVV